MGWDCRCWPPQPKLPEERSRSTPSRDRAQRFAQPSSTGILDRAPLGDIETTLMVLVAGQPDKNIRFRHRVNDRIFELDSGDFRAAEIDLTLPIGLAILREAITKRRSGIDFVRTALQSRPDCKCADFVRTALESRPHKRKSKKREEYYGGCFKSKRHPRNSTAQNASA